MVEEVLRSSGALRPKVVPNKSLSTPLSLFNYTNSYGDEVP